MTDLATAGGWQPALVTTGTIPMNARLIAPGGELGDDVIDIPSNVVLLRGDGRTVLIDAGSGSFAVEWPGSDADLLGALRAAGAAADEVDLVVVTHLDFDHCGGALELPRARVAVPVGAEPSGTAGEHVMEQLSAAGRIEWIEDGGSPAPGLTVRSAPGHRAGHSVVEVGDALVYLADVVHHPLHVEHLDWDREFDTDVELARATRARILDEMAGRGVTVTASHIAGAGRIEHSGGGLRWQQA